MLNMLISKQVTLSVKKSNMRSLIRIELELVMNTLPNLKCRPHMSL